MKVRLSGDICHPGLVEIEVENLEELRELLLQKEGQLADEEDEFRVYDEQSDCLLFQWDGNVFDTDGNEIDLDTCPPFGWKADPLA